MCDCTWTYICPMHDDVICPQCKQIFMYVDFDLHMRVHDPQNSATATQNGISSLEKHCEAEGRTLSHADASTLWMILHA